LGVILVGANPASRVLSAAVTSCASGLVRTDDLLTTEAADCNERIAGVGDATLGIGHEALFLIA
ncbi:MAG: hypothetical protein JJD98_20695, partial [Polaromonas sp.]|nr:hypothetical protein [Polaromonas sp.]